jgi:hypothetical protein
LAALQPLLDRGRGRGLGKTGAVQVRRQTGAA